MQTKLGKKFWITMVILSLIGQIAWVVENMYFNVFLYKMFHASAADISLMVGASAVAATLTTLLIGALSDKIGKRKIFVCGGYIVWGISILSFALIRMDILEKLTGSVIEAASLGISLVILLDCVMTFFGSSANDACFNAWLTDSGDDTNRGKIEGINSMMPLVAILVVFGGFMAFNLELQKSWITIFLIIGISVILIGILCIFLMEDHAVASDENKSYFKNLIYSFRPSVFKNHKLLYMVVLAFAVFGISIQIFMPYLILYYEVSLGLNNYVLIMAPAIILASVITAFYGKLYDMVGFRMSVLLTIIMLMVGYFFLFFFTNTISVFVGSLFMMTGYLTGMAIFGAMIRDNIPREKAGLFQGLRIFGQVFIPGIVGPAIGAAVLKNAKTIQNSDGTTSFIPNHNIYAAAFVAAIVLLFVLGGIFEMIRHGHHDLMTDLGEKCLDKWNNGEQPWKAYPRPQMKRNSYISLNGEWQLNRNTIRVPFAPQSILSGYHKFTGFHLHYIKSFTIPEDFIKGRVLLHFGAVDQIAEIFLNDTLLTKHEGGYLPFEVDITDYLKNDNMENILEVKVIDLLSENYPYGKQCRKRGGMWYTPISGIWQSVWLESVPEDYIKNIKITPYKTGITLKVNRTSPVPVYVTIPIEGDTITAMSYDEEFRIDLVEEMKKLGKEYKPELWTPDSPHLYSIQISAGEDKVNSYFALRTIEIKDIKGQQRICLNGEPIFLHGVLDQGYFSDGIYTPACEKSYEEDILAMKKMGFNTLRKHIKIEPEAFYYACDRLGMLVMQDMVNNGHYSFFRDTAMPYLGKFHRNDHRFNGNKKRKRIFVKHSIATVETLYNHPCIVYYTIFNEGWGQFDSDAMYETIKFKDTTRIIDTTSGWFFGKKTEVKSLHIYYNNKKVPVSHHKPTLVSECGGYSFAIPGHFYSKYTHYGYGNCESEKDVTKKMISMYKEMIIPAIPKGLCGCVYTQLSDVEDEINGLLTYDRKKEKVCINDLQEISRLLHSSL